MGNSAGDTIRALRFGTGLLLLAFLIVKFLFFGTRGLSKFIRPFSWTVLLAAGLWYLHKWQRPDFYSCEACGLEYTCEDEEGREPHGYCEKTASHRHRGDSVKRYDFARGVRQAIRWTRRDMQRVKWAFLTESSGAAEMS